MSDGLTNTVWLSWTAPRSGVVSLFDYSFYWDHFLEVFSGDSLADLVPITNCITWVTFEAAEGTTYSFRISGYRDDVLIRLFLSSFEITSPSPELSLRLGPIFQLPSTSRSAIINSNVKFYANDVPIGLRTIRLSVLYGRMSSPGATR